MIGQTIVIIDDEPALLALLRHVLEDQGYSVVGVNHPDMIAGAIAGRTPSLFLIDIMLPGISGIAVAERLRAGAYSAVPMIGISASGVVIRRAAGSGWFTDTLEKPFDVEALLGCVAEQLELAAWLPPTRVVVRGRDSRPKPTRR